MNRFRAAIAAIALLVALLAVLLLPAQAQPVAAAAVGFWSPAWGLVARLWSFFESPPPAGATAASDGQDTTPNFDPDGLAAPPDPSGKGP